MFWEHIPLLWLIFVGITLIFLALDLGAFGRKEHLGNMKEAVLWSAIWIAVALSFNFAIYLIYGHQKALSFLTGYLVEESLSIDNIFVFIVIFSYFKIPSVHQRKILFWGIIGAIVIRALFIVLGLSLIHRFHWIIYLLGGLLIMTGIQLTLEKDKEIHPDHNPVLKFMKRFVPITNEYSDGKLFIKKNAKLYATPLFIALLAVETTDIIFAVDSIPAILAITTDPFIVYTSNIFAILGLRSLYFVLAGFMKMFYYLHYGLACILVFIGIKMLISKIYNIPIAVTLIFILGTIIVSIVASISHFRHKQE